MTHAGRVQNPSRRRQRDRSPEPPGGAGLAPPGSSPTQEPGVAAGDQEVDDARSGPRAPGLPDGDGPRPRLRRHPSRPPAGNRRRHRCPLPTAELEDGPRSERRRSSWLGAAGGGYWFLTREAAPARAADPVAATPDPMDALVVRAVETATAEVPVLTPAAARLLMERSQAQDPRARPALPPQPGCAHAGTALLERERGAGRRSDLEHGLREPLGA